ncbi:hypothetical protein BJ742DRAFT_787519 [Cladochytrium replicatum]|nr:hypothetical protein BJ742DRAFT_787519 [Cladochytrium replicatum]
MDPQQQAAAPASSVAGSVAPTSAPAPGQDPTALQQQQQALPPQGAAPDNVKIVEEFQFLLEKSQQLFAGLRDLPPTGRNWQPYFQRTFEVYTKLWKFQQQNRAVLENKESYGLKRWEIGEIASKIGQLYYHYYLRTSETNYLYESYVFYEATRDRQYFKDVMDAKNPSLVIKKLRYYARFIVVCLLLNRSEIIKKLMEELTTLVDEYTKVFKPNDAAEWNAVLSEISTFLEAERKLAPADNDGNPLSAPTRLQVERSLKFDKDGQQKLKLQEAILVGNYQNQIKFSELTLDMYRMLQSLEREPATQPSSSGMSMGNKPEAAAEKKEGEAAAGDESAGEKPVATRRTNPHKYLLYRPTLSQLMLYISTAFKDISDNSALLLFLSADGSKRNVKVDQDNSGYLGGVATAVNFARKMPEKIDADQISLVHSLHPGDLGPFTRKPLFVIVDSNNSSAFKVSNHFAERKLLLINLPTVHRTDTTQIGNLFTLFLHSPVKALAFVCNVTETATETWTKSIALMQSAESIAFELLNAPTANIDKSFKRFLQDDFLGQFIVHFLISSALLQSHSSFKDPNNHPTSNPPLSNSIILAPELLSKLQEVVTTLGAEGQFTFNSVGVPTATITAATSSAALAAAPTLAEGAEKVEGE